MSEEDVQVYPYGFQCRASYRQNTKSSDVIGVAYSPFSGDFALLDGSGITHWNKDTQVDRRLLTYPSNKKQLLKQIIFIPKYGVYFALSKDNTVQLLNSLLQRTFVFDADNCTILCMLYCIKRDILVTAGVGGLKMWKYLHHKSDRDQAGTENYFILCKEHYTKPSQWITRVELNEQHNRLLCVAQKEIIILTCDGEHLYTLNTAPCLPLTDCCYAPRYKYYITASIDTALKLWSEQGTLLHSFTAHSKAITSVLMHPQSDMVMISASLDKSVKLWNLETWEEIYKLQVCEHGIQWVGLTKDNQLYCGSARELTVWSIAFLAHFFAQTRVSVTKIEPVYNDNRHKVPRVLTLGDDSSVRLLSGVTGDVMCTVLPPPDISPLNMILDVAYCRYYGLIFLLIDSLSIWVYTSRTNPSSRVDIWDEDVIKLMLHSTEDSTGALGVSGTIQCMTVLHSSITVEGDEGPVSPTSINLLVLALQDGRLVFVDPVVKGLKYHSIAVHRDPICDMREYPEPCWFVITTVSHVTTLTFLSLPFLHNVGKVCIGAATTVYTVLEHAVVSSLNNSVLQTHSLTFNNEGHIESKIISERQQDVHHEHYIHTLDSCSDLDIILTCGTSGTIGSTGTSGTTGTAGTSGLVRIWTSLLIPTREIVLNNTLTTACFLNNRGDVLLGFLSNVYKIPSKYTIDENCTRKGSITSYLTDSTIFEDPTIKYENMGDPPPVNINNYLMPYQGKYCTDWQGLCITDIEESEQGAKTKEEMSEQGDSLAPSDLINSPFDTPVIRSVINLSVSSLSEGVYTNHYDIGVGGVGEVYDAWQMPKCGLSPRSSPPLRPETMALPIPEHPILGIEKPERIRLPVDKGRRPYHANHSTDDGNIGDVQSQQRKCHTSKKSQPVSKSTFDTVLSDLSMTSISDEEGGQDERYRQRKDRKKSSNVPLWKPNGPNTVNQDIQKAIKKKKLEKKRSKKRIIMRRSDSKFNDKFSDITKTTCTDGSVAESQDLSDTALCSEDLHLNQESKTDDDDTLVNRFSDIVTPTRHVDDGTDSNDKKTDRSVSEDVEYLEKSVLDTVAEGVTEGITLEEWDREDKSKLKSSKTKPKKKLKGSLSMVGGSKRKSKFMLSTSPSLVTAQFPGAAERARQEKSAQKKRTVASVTERLTQSRSLITKGLDKPRAYSDIKRVQSAPEARHITPPNLQRSKQSCPLKFSDLIKAEERVSSESKWVLQCLESEFFGKQHHRKRIASAPPRFNHPPGSLRPAYMDKPPKPPIEPIFDDMWHDKILEKHDTRRKIAEQRHIEAAARRKVLNSQKEQRAAAIQEKRDKREMARSIHNMYKAGSPPPPPSGPVPTAMSIHSNLNYRVKSAMSFTQPTPTRPPSIASDYQSSPETSLVSIASSDRGSFVRTSDILAKAAALRNASEQFLCSSTAG